MSVAQMKGLNDSVIFKILNKGNSITGKIKTASSPNLVVSYGKMERILDTFKRKFRYPLTNSMIQGIVGNSILPIYSTADLKVPFSIPSWLMMNGSKLTCYVNLSGKKDIKLDSEDSIDGDIRLIFSLLQEGYIFKGMYENWNTINNNYKIMKEMATTYMKLFRKILDKSHAIKVDNLVYDAISYKIVKFFLINQFGKKPSSSINELAFSLLRTTSNKEIFFTGSDDGIEEEVYKDIDSFITFLSNDEKYLKTLSLRHFYLDWISMYGSSTLYAIELPHFLVMMVANTVVSSREVRGQVVEKALENKEVILYNAIAEIIR